MFSLANNKSYQRTDSYADDNSESDKVIHLSFDDVIGIFMELKEKDPSSIFELNTFDWLKDLHEKYGITVSCYVFYEDGDFNLSQVSGKYKSEFVQNSDWLRFGFHTKDASTDYIEKPIVDDYSRTINELERIVGGESIDNFIRLQMFQCTYEEVQKLTTLKKEPVTGLFTADDNRQSYYLSDDENSYIYSHEYFYDEDLNIWFASTDMRIEYIDNIKTKIDELSTPAWNNQRNCLIIFTHEWALDMENKKKIETLFEYAIKNDYTPVFLEDVMDKYTNSNSVSNY